MSYEFDLRRFNDKIDGLREEQKRLSVQLPKLRDEEQLEISRVQRSYNIKVSQVQSRLQGIEKEIQGLERQIDNTENKIEKEAKEEEEEKESRFRKM